jgi:hypothetical protein
MNPENSRDRAKLYQSMRWSAKKLLPFRRFRQEALKQYVGSNYSDNASSQKMPINMLQLGISIYQRYLSPPRMQCLVTTSVPSLKPTAFEFQTALNHLIEEIDYSHSHRECVLDAMFGMGIIKVGLEIRQVEQELGYLQDAGQPFADPVSLDNYVTDMTATRPDQVAYESDKYRIPYEWVMAQKGFYNSKALANLTPTGKHSFAQDGGSIRAESISQGSEPLMDEYEEMVELRDVWLPRENLFAVLPVDGEGAPLLVKEWEGPESGMYHKMGFNWVPGNLMPLPPVANWVDLNDLMNRIWRKLGRQAERQKAILGVSGPGGKDGKLTVQASDGEAVYFTNPESVKELRYGGIDNQSLGFAINIKDTLVYLMGNIESLGGFAAQSSTLGQDRMLSESANKMVDDMQQSVSYFNQRVFRDIAIYMWQDPHINLPLVKRIEGTDIEIPFQWSPESREGDFAQYNITFEPYTLRSTTPRERLNQLNQVMSQVVMPGMEMFAQQGVQFDMKKYLNTIAKYSNMEELNDILLPVEKGRDPVEPYPGRKMAPVVPRSYEHINIPGGPSPASQSQQLQQAALAGAPPQAGGQGG